MPKNGAEGLPVSPEEWAQLDVPNKADWVVTQYVTSSVTQAIQKVEREMHGEGCGCGSCLKSAAGDANSWVDFLDIKGEYPRYKPTLNNGGKLVVQRVRASELE